MEAQEEHTWGGRFMVKHLEMNMLKEMELHSVEQIKAKLCV